MNDVYRNEDFPWPFYFNGELMPKWGACWGMACITDFLHKNLDADQDIGHRDVWIISCQIDHVGVVESADPDVFIYVIQEVLTILLGQHDAIVAILKNESPDVYPDLVAAAFRMRELAMQRRCAFWTSGYEADRVRLLEVMRRCLLPPDSPEFTLAPHVRRVRSEMRLAHEMQVRQLHQLAQTGQFDKDSRRRLHEIRVGPSEALPKSENHEFHTPRDEAH